MFNKNVFKHKWKQVIILNSYFNDMYQHNAINASSKYVENSKIAVT